MDLATVSISQGGFYVPAFSVQIAGVDLLRTHLVAVAQIEADLVLSAPGRFSFTVVDAYSIKHHAFLSGRGEDLLKVLTFGAQVKVLMGYGDIKGLATIITGTITEIATNFPETGTPELTIAGYDHAFPMTLGKNSHPWANASDSDVIAQLARGYNLIGDIETTKEKYPVIEQNQESDLEFINKLAKRNHYTVYVREDTLRFRKPKEQGDGALRLRWGEGLLSFKPEANLAGQISQVEVIGWNVNTKESIVGHASSGSVSGLDSGHSSAANLLGNAKFKQPVLRLRQPVFSQADADNRAKAVLNEKAKQFLTGEAESIGLPDIRPDTNVALDNLGAHFSKTYYVQQATHKVDTNGYRTRFKVAESSLKIEENKS
jgi:phage protein D